MALSKSDVAVVGAGIVGLAHAYTAAKAGKSVTVFERNPAAIGASIRNFGMVWPIGQPPGEMHEMALRSRAIWDEVLAAAQLPHHATGSLHATYEQHEAAVGQEFAAAAPSLGYDCAWLSPQQTLERSSALRRGGLLGALWSPTEITVDPRLTLKCLPLFLAERYRVMFHFNTAVQSIAGSTLTTGVGTHQAETVILAGGDDFQTLYPHRYAALGLTRCKLQMMRTVQQPGRWQLGPALAFGPTFLHYPTFRICKSLAALEERLNREYPEFQKWGIHVLVSQTAAGELTIGDSHEYGLAVSVFDRPAVNQLLLDYAQHHLCAPTMEIAETWHGVYAKHPELPYVAFEAEPGVTAVTVTSGIGMTLAFGLAERTFRKLRLIV